MYLRRLTSERDEMFLTAFALYEASFPSFEQRNMTEQVAILGSSEYHFDIIYDDNNFVGILLYWETESFVYVEHFCIDTSIRGKGYGQKALSLLSEKSKTIILEIDPPIDDISLRRKAFYLKAGFVANKYPHIHPPYDKSLKGHELIVMSCPNPLSLPQYTAFNLYLGNTVMHQQ